MVNIKSLNSRFKALKKILRQKPQTWLVTGCAGFIGSHLVENLLNLGQKVVGLDNFSTGSRKNLNFVKKAVGIKAWKNFHFIQGDITRINDCLKAFRVGSTSKKKGIRKRKIDVVLHQAGLGSVPRSLLQPLEIHAANVTGTINMLFATYRSEVKRFVYASSSSVYGDSPKLPKREENIGQALSPYAVSKRVDELYAKVFGRCYGLETIGLRYFNVFGPRQNPQGHYAAVIPRWIAAIRKGENVKIYGDGKTSRDFCFVDNVVQANLLAATVRNRRSWNEIYNVACGKKTSLLRLHHEIVRILYNKSPHRKSPKPHKQAFRTGDVRHSLACIQKGRRMLGYQPEEFLRRGIEKTVSSFL